MNKKEELVDSYYQQLKYYNKEEDIYAKAELLLNKALKKSKRKIQELQTEIEKLESDTPKENPPQKSVLSGSRRIASQRPGIKKKINEDF